MNVNDPNKTLDLDVLLSALSASGVTATFYPRDLQAGEPGELLGLSAVLELPAGAIASDEDMERADYVIVGGVVVKNREGPVHGYAKGNIWSDISGPGRPAPHAMVHLGTKFDIGQQVRLMRRRGDVNIELRGEVVGVTQYRDREPSYLIAPDEAGKALLGGLTDVQADEGEISAMIDAGAEDPDAGRQAEPRPKPDAPVEQSYESWLVQQHESLLRLHALLGEPPSLSDHSVTEFGYKPLGQLRSCICEHLRATISAVEERLREIRAG